MKRSELKNLVKEIILSEDSYIDTSKLKIGQKTSSDTVTTTLTDIDPETGKLSWDVKYDVNPEELYRRLSDLVDFLRKAPGNSELGKIRDEVKSIKNRTRRLITQHKS
jgi:hypothetical protein